MSKQAFIAALKAGLRGKAAAVEAGYSAKTAAQMAAKLIRDPEVVAAFDGTVPRGVRGAKVEDETLRAAREAVSLERRVAASLERQGRKSAEPPDYSILGLDPTDDPKAFLTQLMNCQILDPKLRKEAAVALMPFVHKKLGEGGKKESRQAAAEEVGSTGRFTQGRAPLSVVKN